MSSGATLAVVPLEYFEVTRPAIETAPVPAVPVASPSVGVPEIEVETRILAACLRERAEVETRMHDECSAREAALRAELDRTVRAFLDERTAYFARVEGEVVQLALAVARKILGREAQLDPMLLTGLVRVALDGMQGRPAVRVRVAPEHLAAWQVVTFRDDVLVEPDAALGKDECLLVTEVGEARLSVEAQLKEVEQGFLDLLGHRPDTRAGQSERPVVSR